MNTSPLVAVALAVWTLIRVFAVGLLYVNVIVGYFACVLLDTLDGDMFQRLGVSRSFYQKYDKFFDLWFYFALAYYCVLHIEIIWLQWLLLGLFTYRLIGDVLFFLTNKEWLLFVFPNIFSDLFILYFIYPAITDHFTIVFIGLLFFAFVKEWWIHIAKLDVSDMLFKSLRVAWKRS